jgi:hypothetical protein
VSTRRSTTVRPELKDLVATLREALRAPGTLTGLLTAEMLCVTHMREILDALEEFQTANTNLHNRLKAAVDCLSEVLGTEDAAEAPDAIWDVAEALVDREREMGT